MKEQITFGLEKREREEEGFGEKERQTLPYAHTHTPPSCNENLNFSQLYSLFRLS